MSGPKVRLESAAPRPLDELQLDELTQEIDAPLTDFLSESDEQTSSTLDVRDIESALDW
jgi:hypothetical protein